VRVPSRLTFTSSGLTGTLSSVCPGHDIGLDVFRVGPLSKEHGLLRGVLELVVLPHRQTATDRGVQHQNGDNEFEQRFHQGVEAGRDPPETQWI
jgi:hypothetical protein